MPDDRTDLSDVRASADELPLVRRAQRGDRSAMEELARRWRPRLVHLLRCRTACLADAEDIAQQSLVRVFQRIDQHDGRRPFSVWVYRIAVRAAADFHRKRRPEPGLDGGSLSDPRSTDPQEAAAKEELRENLWSIARRAVSDDQYTALWLRYAEEMSILEVAVVLGRTRISTRVLLHRARRCLAPHVLALVEPDPGRAPADNPAASTLKRPTPCQLGDSP